MVRNRDVMSTSSMSGFPFAVLSHRELTHMASNWSSLPSCSTTVFSTIRPVKPLWASITFTIGVMEISWRSLLRRYSGIPSFSRSCRSIFRTFSL